MVPTHGAPGGFLVVPDAELGVLRNLDSYIAKRPVTDCARDTSDDLFAVADLVARLGALDLEHLQAPVDLAAVVQPGDRLLARIAALRERDVRLVEARLGREDRVVDSLPQAGAAASIRMRSTSSAERVGSTSASSSSDAGLAELLVRDPAVLAEDDDRRVLLRLDLDLGREPRAKQGGADRLAEPGSVRSRKSSSARRTTTSGAITRAFGVSSRRGKEPRSRRSRPSAGGSPPRRARRPGRSRAAGAATLRVTVAMVTSVGIVFRSKAEQKVADAGYDPARLPPGQYLTEKWPVLHAGGVPATDLATWDFKVFGEVENPVTLQLGRAPGTAASEVTIDIHCVTRWSRFDTSFRGVSWATLAELVKPKPSARFVVAHAEQGFTSNVPIAALEDEQSLIAYEADGEPLTPEHGWPSGSSSRAATSGRAPSGCAASSSCRQTSPASGSATATTTTRTTGKKNGMSSSVGEPLVPPRAPSLRAEARYSGVRSRRFECSFEGFLSK